MEQAIVVRKGEEINDIDEVIVSDNCDSVLILERIEDEVNLNKAGEYKLGYRVVDSSGNETIVYRDVIVEENNYTIWYIIGALLGVISLGFTSFVVIRRKQS